jgi:protease-4
MATDKSRSVVGIFILIFVLFVIFMIFAFYTIASLKSTGKAGNSILFDKNKAPIAVIEVNGVIMDSKKTIELLHTAEKEESIKAIILRVDSPGGAVGPTQEIYEEILRIDKDKPVYSSFASVAASGGYYVGAATRKIYSNAGTLTGSIGVIMQFMDMSKLYEFAKLNPQTIKAGKYKDVGSPFRKMKAEEKKLLDTMIDGVHRQFIVDILKRRKKRIKGKLTDHAQGQIFSGRRS